jgi:hypothetical protein
MASLKLSQDIANIGVSVLYHIDGDDTSLYTVEWSFGSQVGTLKNKERKSSSYWETFTLPLSLYNEMPDRTDGAVILVLTEYDATTGAQLSYSVEQVTARVVVSSSTPTIALPAITCDHSLTEDLTGSTDKVICYFSPVTVSVNVNARNGAEISHVVLTHGNSITSTNAGKLSKYTFNVSVIQNDTFIISATDSRGLTSTITYTLPAERFVAYEKLTCVVGSEMPDTNGVVNLTCSGVYFNGTFGRFSNSLSVQCRYKDSNGTPSQWQTMDVSIDADTNTYTANATISGLDYSKTYVFECKAEDAVMTVTDTGDNVRALPLFHWGENDFVFEVPVTFKQGATIGEPTAAGTWTPKLKTAAAVSSYSLQSGWYMRVGNVVTVGFNIGASCKSGYNSTAIAIEGLPFTPASNAFGGGVMFGAYVNAGFCFEAWAATTSGEITPRLQPCNNTSAANLQISSTAYYPSGASSLTLGGTITYLTNE